MVYEKSYADNEEDKTLIYHYDHLGSTKLVTDIDGEPICRFDYGTYGELLTTEYVSDGAEDVSEDDLEITDASRIKFLYNGQLGVITDDNGLYYMRSRYYNPEIKRFINQDILTGSIGSSASLNRYSYVEGNPVSYTDPFGLSPFRAVHDVFHALYYIPVIGHGIAAADALIYLAEGEYTKAGVSAIYAIPGGTGVGFAIEATAGVTAFFLPDDMVENHDNPIIQDLYEYSHYDEMSKGQIALYTIINGISAYGELKAFNTEPVYEGDYIDFNRPEVRESVINKGLKDSDFVTVGTGGSASDELVHVYRGTNKYTEISVFNETGQLMSDATRNVYLETGNLKGAYVQSNSIHNSWLKIWGNENDFVQAHAAFGAELSEAFGLDRTFMSVTTDLSVARKFAGEGGRVFEAYIPKSQLIKQTLSGAGESEYLIRFGSGGFK